MRVLLAFLVALALTSGIAVTYLFTSEREEAPALGGLGASAAGEAKEAARLEDKSRAGWEETASGPEGTGSVMEASRTESDEDAGSGNGNEAPLSEPVAGGLEDGGQVDRSTDTLPSDLSPAPPVASFAVSPGEGQSPLRVHLDASPSYDPDGTIVSYAWSCGGSGVSLYHVFESNVIPAVMAITLTVTDNGGHTASCTRYVTLY